jgi:Leucine-rich repeat (LRR) protein
LSGNQIVDVSALTLPDGLTGLVLSHNQIVDVSALTLPDGLTKLYLSGNCMNQIVDV